MLRPVWRYVPQGLLWRVVPAGSGLLLGEVRTEDRKNAWFFCLEERTGHVLWERLDFGLGWWCGVEAVSGGLVFLHGFASPDLPVHKSVHAVDLWTGRLLWSAQGLRFVKAGVDTVYAHEETLAGVILLALDARTGARRRTEVLEDGAVAPMVNATENAKTGEPAFPVPLPSVGRVGPDVAGILSELSGPVETGPTVEVLLVDGLVIACRTTMMERLFRSELMVIGKSGNRMLYRDEIAAAVAPPAPESFFVRGGMLIYIKDRTMLTGVDLRAAEGPKTEGSTP